MLASTFDKTFGPARARLAAAFISMLTPLFLPLQGFALLIIF